VPSKEWSIANSIFLSYIIHLWDYNNSLIDFPFLQLCTGKCISRVAVRRVLQLFIYFLFINLKLSKKNLKKFC
jgi:hypothetical protein